MKGLKEESVKENGIGCNVRLSNEPHRMIGSIEVSKVGVQVEVREWEGWQGRREGGVREKDIW